jgi:hypothetical protein
MQSVLIVHVYGAIVLFDLHDYHMRAHTHKQSVEECVSTHIQMRCARDNEKAGHVTFFFSMQSK